MEADNRLKFWLGEMYRADVLGVGRRDEVFRLACSTVVADPALMSQVHEQVPELEKVVRTRRDNAHVEKKTLEYMKKIEEVAANG